ncbi:MAG TPA: hopanoid C-3 methylase HpnR [Kofleriaceae bacterium]|nr:hopanoid C-3 methylase HpnR [Kofleriaceae bacterium]
MKVLCVHPSGLMYNEIFLRLEPLGVELVAAAVRAAGHDVRLLDLQAATHADYFRTVDEFRPDAVLIGMNYLANVPEVVDLCKATKARYPRTLTCVGGHSASFTARELIKHGAGAIDCVARGEGEEIAPRLLEAWRDDPAKLHLLDGIVTAAGEGPPPKKIHSLDTLRPARDLLPNRKKYFIGVLDPAASIEFSRGCPWDCAFCSAWTFYGRSYRQIDPELCAEDLASIREPGVFIVDDVAFIHADHGNAIADALERRRIRKRFYLETRGDVLMRNKDVFARWKRLGLEYMFLGIEAIDAEGLKAFRKRVSIDKNFEALECARSLGITVAINIIADPDWDAARFAVIREWALSVPEIVNISVNTPYPGTETFASSARVLTTRDYRLFDIQHAVLPTRLPLPMFYAELVKTQQVLNRKHLGLSALASTAAISARLLLKGQTNFIKMLWKFNSVYNPERQLADHARPVKYEMDLPMSTSAAHPARPRHRLFVLQPG